MAMQWFAGLMTGTVLDGQIDIALLRTDGAQVAEFGAYELVPYREEICEILRQCVDAARLWNFNGPDPEIFNRAERALTLAQADAVKQIVAKANLELHDIAAVGFHGQTVLHRAPTPARRGETRQLGDGQLMADLLGVPVVYDLRRADVEAGGHGAPLCASYHGALLDRIGAGEETAVLNLGGVANLSWKSASGHIIAFDTGPANAPINDWVKGLGAGDMDRDGALAAMGTVDETRLQQLVQHPYLQMPFPKSLDRFDFAADMAKGNTLENGAALLTAFSASAVASGLNLLPVKPRRLILSGGGRKNHMLVREIGQRAGVETVNADSYGWRGDAVEAECFAFLAARRKRNLPFSFPGTTGVPEPMTGGTLAEPSAQDRCSLHSYH